MKLDLPQSNVQRGHQMEEETFGIESMALILGILREGMYSSPIQVITQEISSNARDAHREVGKHDVPIEITLPTKLNGNQFIIRDLGPSVTPERMTHVFIKYGASTKRSDDGQTGGWGLGAKTPWSYGDQFGVISITTEEEWIDVKGTSGPKGQVHENVNVKREYVCYIDESKLGKGAKIYEAVTDEPQGLAVVVGVNAGDEGIFKKYVVQATRFWKTLPKIHGFNYPKLPVRYEGKDKDWLLLDQKEVSYDEQRAMVLLDDIPYEIDAQKAGLTQLLNEEVECLSGKPVYLRFETGELMPTATREDLDYSFPGTGKKIADRLQKVHEEIREIITEEVEKAPNLWEANIAFNDHATEFAFETLNWHGTPVDGRHITFSQFGVSCCRFDKSYRGTDKFRRKPSHEANSVTPSLDTLLVLDDDPDNTQYPSRQRLHTLFNENPHIQHIFTVRAPYVISIPRIDKNGKAFLDEEIEKKEKEQDNNIKAFKELTDKLDPTVMSDVNKTILPRAVGYGTGQRSPITKVYQYCPDATKSKWQPVEIDLSGAEGYYVLIDNRKPIVFNNKVEHEDSFEQLHKGCVAAINNGVTVYGIPRRFATKLKKSSLESFETLITRARRIVTDDKNFDLLTVLGCDLDYKRSLMNERWSTLWTVVEDESIIPMLNDQRSPAARYIRTTKLLRDRRSATQRLETVAKLIGVDRRPEDRVRPIYEGMVVRFRKLADKFEARYPLAAALQGYGASRISPEQLAFYLNACDAEVEASENATESVTA